MKEKRIEQILEYVVGQQSVSLDELVTAFSVSKNTIRRDIQELMNRGNLKKVYGGVSVIQRTLEPFQDRKVQNQGQKKQIAKKAAYLVNDGDIIFIDSGTTTIEMLEYIKEMNLTIFTNNIDFIARAIPYERLNVISTGGMLNSKTNSFNSPRNFGLLKDYNIKKAFMASTGISLSNGVTNSSPLESELKKIVVNRSAEVYLLVDHTKFDSYGLITYCQLQEVDYVITNAMPADMYQQYAAANNVQLIVADES